MQIVAVANHKGGVGKTTSAVNIACWGEMGQKVLVVDLDPQGSASLSFGIKNDGGWPIILSAPKSNGAEDYHQVALWLSEHIGDT